MNTIKLNFINRSNDQNNSQVVIFQKNVAADLDELAVAWKVIDNCGQGDNHPFNYPMQDTVAASDSYGNFTPQLPASFGQAFDMVRSKSGDILQLSGTPAVDPQEIGVRNLLQTGSISAYCFRDNSVCALKSNIAPGQEAVFTFKPNIWIGVASQILQGEVINSAIISNINTELSLLGISEADIIMTGGGPGADSQPFVFSMENIVYA